MVLEGRSYFIHLSCSGYHPQTWLLNTSVFERGGRVKKGLLLTGKRSTVQYDSSIDATCDKLTCILLFHTADKPLSDGSTDGSERSQWLPHPVSVFWNSNETCDDFIQGPNHLLVNTSKLSSAKHLTKANL